MSTKKGISPFQFLNYQVNSFRILSSSILITGDGSYNGNINLERKITYNKNNSISLVNLLYTHDLTLANNSNPNVKFRIEASIYGVFSYDDGNENKIDMALNKEDLDRYIRLLQLNGTASLISLLRTSVQNATNALGYSFPILIPNINLNEFEFSNDILEDSSAILDNKDKDSD